ncbi:hypothetical protein MSSAC_2431 [Methanosarcina siciliae C2J]|uniref:Uncharacterized protein n=3 Tax=Methanosarcina siciliae TaxID=38027 RepID=A0A0E3PEM6_9EURY|nr:hypothetical protein [Methanosarcina siciliae]AKB28775.1 hypothetical protein MSSIT_2056 [Methanosarcina siciliae T4/M]AKB32707.1 hypothetical protein MSSIH_2017 [Methanosarcina siciliae HI350]AKB37021.1 hypothetical protein MSSAC_2431 [Methanosarcina siciliae C2J]
MDLKDEELIEDQKTREFGVFGDVLRELQLEEIEETDTCLVEIQETAIKENTIEILTEIRATLKEIAETQKKILEEIQKNRLE